MKRRVRAIVSAITHRSEKRIKVTFTDFKEGLARIREVPGSRWSQSEWYWHVPYTSVQSVFKKALARARIRRNASVHTLRHSFATHLICRGADSKYVQDLLGHNSIKTTEIYLHISNTQMRKLQSPLDNLDID